MEQMELSLWELLQPEQQVDSEQPEEFRPGRCPHERSCVDMGDTGNIKSECDLSILQLGHTIWTNCRVCGYCTLRSVTHDEV